MVKLPKSIQRDMAACLQCGYCVQVCDTYKQSPWESNSPRGKVYYLNQLAKRTVLDQMLGRKVDIDDEFINALYWCTGCARCWTVCHVSIEFAEFWETVREWCVEQGKGPLPAHVQIRERLEELRNPYNEPMEKRAAWWPKDVPKSPNPQSIFFAGCTASYRMNAPAKAGVTVLHRAGVTLNTLGEKEWCCTSPALRTGQTKLTAKFAENNITKAERMGAQSMVMTCAGCYKTTSHDYGRYYANPPFPVQHFTQMAAQLIKDKKLKFTKEIKAKVTYHDPCHLGRHAHVFDEPRECIKAVPGIEFIEMKHVKMDSRCCGAGGGFKSANNDFAVNIAAERVKEAVDTGAELLVTSCPFCVLNLSQGAKKIGANIKVMDISELLLQATDPVVEEKKTEVATEKKA
ncbi:MAG: 4Fe-4S dicluster domain-containing protein [Methanomassiliicoccales archaeon]|nr:MAG: 4Fe-4S dicluster domain-containing protein [Methanomassiliicoccales archaeon]